MGTTSSFFGGGGGGSSITTPSSPELKNITFQNNTTFSVPTNRGYAPNVIPLKDNMFFLAEGASTSKIYVSLWTINDDGSCTNTAAAIQLSDFNEIGSATSNGIDTLMILGGGNYDKIRTVTWDGSSTLSNTLRRTLTSPATLHEHCTVGCLYDGTLLGVLGADNGGYIGYRYTIVPPTLSGFAGTAFDGITNVYMNSAANTGKTCITGNGLYYLGTNSSNSNYMAAGHVGLQYSNNSNLVTFYNNQSQALKNPGSGSYRCPHMFPLKSGAVQSRYMDSSYKEHNFIQNNNGGAALAVSPQFESSQSVALADNYNIFQDYHDKAQHFVRQSTGGYSSFRGGSTPAMTTVFDDDLYQANYGFPFQHMSIRAPSGSSGITHKTGAVVVGNYVVVTALNDNSNELYLNTWKLG